MLPDGLQQPAIIEPVDPGQHGDLNRFEASPWPAPVDDLGLAESVDGPGQRVGHLANLAVHIGWRRFNNNGATGARFCWGASVTAPVAAASRPQRAVCARFRTIRTDFFTALQARTGARRPELMPSPAIEVAEGTGTKDARHGQVSQPG